MSEEPDNLPPELADQIEEARKNPQNRRARPYLTEETYEEYCKRTRDRVSDEMMEGAARRQARIEAGAKALCTLLDEDWDSLSPAARRVYKGYAKAVLDAADETEGK